MGVGYLQRQKLILMNLSLLRTTAISMFIFASLSTNAQNTNAPKFGKGLFNLIGKDSTWSMKVGLRFQTLATSNWDTQNGLSNPASSMMIRRS